MLSMAMVSLHRLSPVIYLWIIQRNTWSYVHLGRKKQMPLKPVCYLSVQDEVCLVGKSTNFEMA